MPANCYMYGSIHIAANYKHHLLTNLVTYLSQTTLPVDMKTWVRDKKLKTCKKAELADKYVQFDRLVLAQQCVPMTALL